MDPFFWDDEYDDSVIEIDRLPEATEVAITQSKKNMVTAAGAIADALGVVGKLPNAIPSATPSQQSDRRQVQVGSHPVQGWLLAQILDLGGVVLFGPSLDSGSTFDTKGPPDPTYHWSVIVGHFYHELNTDNEFNNLYRNGRFEDQDWKVFDIGYTTFNDEAIRVSGNAGEDVISRMAKVNPKYDVFNNNCQLMTVTVNLLNQICDGGVPELFSSWKMLHLEDPTLLKKSPPASAAVEVMLKNTPTLKKKAK
ncbi:MAG: hypothetical protein M1812_001622 [Candelaria pacifica]|nr:MAG: hypothetical protein M1812_001622 [Candelaria pacifica]